MGSANMIAVAVAGAGKDVEVITPGCTFSTCIAPLEQFQMKIVFTDVELGRYVPSVEMVMEKVTDNTKMIFIPNLLGYRFNFEALDEALKKAGKREQIVVIEDSCDTMINTPGSDIAVTSFYASHVMTAGGMGGMAMFNDKTHLDRAFQYRDWGRIGNNSEDPSDRFNHSVDGIPYD